MDNFEVGRDRGFIKNIGGEMICSVIGLGKLGLPLACIFSQAGFKVIGIDHDEKLINEFKFGRNPIQETGLDCLFRRNKKLIDFTQSYDTLGDITFIVVPTPSVKNRFSSVYIEEALDKIKTNQKVVIVSTVMPGETDRLQKKYPHLKLVYNPAFIALGNVIENFTYPDFILIGSNLPCFTKFLKKIYKTICGNVKFCILSPLEAEVTKLALNCYLTTKITFANQIGNLCYKLGIDGKKVCKAISQDSRVGTKYFTPGLGYGGPCLPRDNRALVQVMNDNKTEAILPDVIDQLNENQVYEIVNRVMKLKPKSIGFKSLSYKDGTENKDNSQLETIYEVLKNRGYKVLIGKGEVNFDWRGIL